MPLKAIGPINLYSYPQCPPYDGHGVFLYDKSISCDAKTDETRHEECRERREELRNEEEGSC